MKKIFLIALMFVGVQAFAQTVEVKTEQTNNNTPKLPSGVEKGLSITYNEVGQLIFVTEKKSIYDDIEQIKIYVNHFYWQYQAWSPSVEHKKGKWILVFNKK